jgi:allantoin racemase
MVRSFVPLVERNAMECRMTGGLASIRVIEVPVLELRKDLDKTVSILADEGRKAVEEDGAQVVILGCTGMTGMAAKVSERSGITVIDPLPAAVKMAESLVRLGLSHSRLAYMRPPEKDRYL